MPRRLTLLACLLAPVGCQTAAPAPEPRAVVEEPQYDAVTASALVFDPPVVQGEPPLELSRAGRGPRVAVGYEELTAESFYIRLDDRQISDGIRGGGGRGRFGGGGSYDRYERRAVTERVGVRYR